MVMIIDVRAVDRHQRPPLTVPVMTVPIVTVTVGGGLHERIGTGVALAPIDTAPTVPTMTVGAPITVLTPGVGETTTMVQVNGLVPITVPTVVVGTVTVEQLVTVNGLVPVTVPARRLRILNGLGYLTVLGQAPVAVSVLNRRWRALAIHRPPPMPHRHLPGRHHQLPSNPLLLQWRLQPRTPFPFWLLSRPDLMVHHGMTIFQVR